MYQCVSRVCHHIYLKYCACHEQVRPGHTKRCACHAKSSRKTSRSDAQRPDLLTSLMNVSLVLRLPRDMRLCRPSSNVPRLLTFGKSEQGAESLAPATQNRILTSKSGPRASLLTCECASRHKCVRFLDISTSKSAELRRFVPSTCALRRNGVRFFNISTSKSAPNMWCFYHSDFDMCFAPQRRAHFEHLNV